jgi:hypothetical protein
MKATTYANRMDIKVQDQRLFNKNRLFSNSLAYFFCKKSGRSISINAFTLN